MKLNKEVALHKAKVFLEKRYPELKSNEQWLTFDNIYWAKSGTKSSRKKKWYSYHKKTPSSWICPIGGVDVKPQLGLEIALVHELTHIIQYIFGLPVGELLTTVNEQEYVFENYPYYSKFLVTYEARKFQELLFKRKDKQKAKFKQVNGKWMYVLPR